MQPYHLRRAEKEITNDQAILAIIAGQRYMTLALCKDNVPYLVTLNYGYDAANQCLYFHCAGEGKKLDYIAANPTVWGQILEDRGYLDGQCDHAFRCVEFEGTASLVSDHEEKRHALATLIEHLESDADAIKQQRIQDEAVRKVTIGKISVRRMYGKQNGIAE